MKIFRLITALLFIAAIGFATSYELITYSPADNYNFLEGTDSMFVQAAVFKDSQIYSGVKLNVLIENTNIDQEIEPGLGNIFRDSLDISELEIGSYVLELSVPSLEISKKLNFEIVTPEEGETIQSANLFLDFISPQSEQYSSSNVLVRVQLKDINGMIPDDAEVTGVLSYYDEKVEDFNLKLSMRLFEKMLILDEEGEYSLQVTAELNGNKVIKSVNFYYGETEEEYETASEYNVFLTVVSPPETNSYVIDEEIPFYVMFKDTNDMFVDGEVKFEVYDQEEELIHEEDLSRNRQYFTNSYTFKEEGVYRILFIGDFETFQNVQKTRLVYIETNKEDVNKLSIQIMSPKEDVYPDNAKLIARARLRYKNEPVKNATVIAVVNELEYEMTYDSFGEYTVKLPKLMEDEYKLSVVAKEGELVGEANSEFKISKQRLNINLNYPDEGTIFLKRDNALTFSFDISDERGDIAHGAEISLGLTDPEGKEIQSKIYQTETGEYTGIVYLDKRGTYQFTATGEKAGYVSDSIESTFTLDIEDLYVFGFEFETLLNIILILAILILVAGFLKGIF